MTRVAALRPPPLRIASVRRRSLQRRAASAKPALVTARRLLPLLTLLALIVAPFGRVAAAEAMMTSHQPAAMSGHCQDMPAPEPADRTGKSSIDCLVACAAISTAETFVLGAKAVAASPQDGLLLPVFAGLHPEAEPPPPRFS